MINKDINGPFQYVNDPNRTAQYVVIGIFPLFKKAFNTELLIELAKQDLNYKFENSKN